MPILLFLSCYNRVRSFAAALTKNTTTTKRRQQTITVVEESTDKVGYVTAPHDLRESFTLGECLNYSKTSRQAIWDLGMALVSNGANKQNCGPNRRSLVSFNCKKKC